MTNEEKQQEEAPSPYPLAFDANGEPLEVPVGAVAWRVRRGGGRRGRPRIVFDNETGRQLEIPIGGTLADLIDRGCPPGRYRLEAVDASGRLIAGCIGVTEIPIEAEADEEEEEEQIDTNTKKNLIALIARQQATIERLTDALKGTHERQSDSMSRAIEAMASGYGDVRPAPVSPVVVDPRAGAGAGLPFKLEQLGELMPAIQWLIHTIKSGGAAMPFGGAPGAEGGAAPAPATGP